jgi:flagellar basal body-associated protein FliL
MSWSHMLKKILSVINIVSQIILMITAVISLLTAYIVFAPDDLPKPFRLVYASSGQVPTVAVEHVAAPEPVSETHEYQPGDGIMVNMSTKIINLLDPGGRKYIRLTVVVEVAPDNPEYESLPHEEKTHYLSEFEDKLNARMPIMDDTVITLLSTKNYDELYTAEGKEELRLEIIKSLSGKLPDLNIISIYFTEFVVQ